MTKYLLFCGFLLAACEPIGKVPEPTDTTDTNGVTTATNNMNCTENSKRILQGLLANVQTSVPQECSDNTDCVIRNIPSQCYEQVIWSTQASAGGLATFFTHLDKYISERDKDKTHCNSIGASDYLVMCSMPAINYKPLCQSNRCVAVEVPFTNNVEDEDEEVIAED